MNRRILGLRLRGGRLSAILGLVVPLLLLSTTAQGAAPAGTTYTTPFALYCGGAGPACTPLWTITVLTGQRLGIEYQVAPGHCASFNLHVYLDGKQVASRTMGSPRTPGPRDTGVIAVSSVVAEAHVIGL